MKRVQLADSEVVIQNKMILEVNFGYLEPPDISNFFLGPIEFEITRFDCIFNLWLLS